MGLFSPATTHSPILVFRGCTLCQCTGTYRGTFAGATPSDGCTRATSPLPPRVALSPHPSVVTCDPRSYGPRIGPESQHPFLPSQEVQHT